MRLVTTALLAVTIAACGTGTAPARSTTEAQSAPDSDRVSRADMGADWPFTVESGVLSCEPVSEVVLIASDGETYGLNGGARGSGQWADGLDILANGKTGADLGGLIERGLALCD